MDDETVNHVTLGKNDKRKHMNDACKHKCILKLFYLSRKTQKLFQE